MGHYLSTLNPDAAEAADSWQPAEIPLVEEPAPPEPTPDVSDLPRIGMDVVYHVRDGDSRNMRIMFPATVIDVDPQTRTLSLIIMVDAGDLWRQDRVSRRAAPEPGWDWIEARSPLTPFGEDLSARLANLERAIVSLRNGLRKK